MSCRSQVSCAVWKHFNGTTEIYPLPGTHTHTICGTSACQGDRSVFTPGEKKNRLVPKNPALKHIDRPEHYFCAFTLQVMLENLCQSSITNVACIRETNWKSLTMEWKKWHDPGAYWKFDAWRSKSGKEKKCGYDLQVVQLWLYFKLYMVENITPFRAKWCSVHQSCFINIVIQ